MANNQESMQRYLGRNRPPRVQITYDVEIGDAFETMELPLVVGILSDLSGNASSVPAQALSASSFVEIDRDNFDTVMSKINPGLSFDIDNPNAGQKGELDKLQVNLSFSCFDDFSPANIVSQVDSLKDLFNTRQRLQEMLIKLDGNQALDQSLVAALGNSAALTEFQTELATALAPPVVVATTVTPTDGIPVDGTKPVDNLANGTTPATNVTDGTKPADNVTDDTKPADNGGTTVPPAPAKS